jgi:hypothetical protein
MTPAEIQLVLRTLHRESMGSVPTLREMREQKSQSNTDWPAIFAALEARGLPYAKPAPGRTDITLAGLTPAEQAQVEAYAERLADEARALVERLRARGVESQRAADRLERREDDAQWLRAHIRKARRWLEQPQMESVN